MLQENIIEILFANYAEGGILRDEKADAGIEADKEKITAEALFNKSLDEDRLSCFQCEVERAAFFAGAKAVTALFSGRE